MKSNRARNAVFFAAFVAILIAEEALAQGVLRRSATIPKQQTRNSGDPIQRDVDKCEIKTAISLDFGDYLPGQTTTLTGTGSVSTRCNRGNIAMILAAGPSLNTGSITLRALRSQSGSEQMNYQLFTDSSRVTIWGNILNGGQPFFSQKNASEQTFTYYGSIAAGQSIGPGDYSDRISITVLP